MSSITPCPEADRLRDLLEAALPAEEQAELTRHLDDCDACRQRLEALAGDPRPWRPAAGPWDEGPAVPGTLVQRALDALDSRADEFELRSGRDPDAEVFLDFLRPSDRPDSLGRLGPYEVLEVIGRGGMGVVLKALDPALNRLVAVKLVAPQLASSAAARKRFAREARAAAAICHEHVVTIHAVEETDGRPYLVMHYVPGITLQERIERTGPLELKEILRIGMQTAAGLAAAHAQGLVHRDVTPANILLENGVERVKLTDFGLARAIDDSSLTQNGVLAGTPDYMSPEQARGDPVDHRTDLFSLGSVLYAMCTGRPPFRGSTTLAMLRRLIEESPRPIREINPDIPGWLCAIIAKLHAKDPDDRFASAAEVAELLRQHLAHLQQPELVPMPPPVSRDRGRSGRRWLLAAGVVVALLSGLSVTEATGQTQLTRLLGTVLRIRTPEGTLVVEVDDPDVQVSVDDDGKDVVITGAGLKEVRLRPGAHTVRATRDGKELRHEVVSIERDGRKIVRITHESDAPPLPPPVRGPAAVSEVEKKLGEHDRFLNQFPGRGARRGVEAGRGASAPPPPARFIVRLGAEIHGHTDTVYSVAFSPDGQQFVSASADSTVRLWDARTGREIRQFDGHTLAVTDAVFSPDGRRILSCGEDRSIRSWDVTSGSEVFRVHGQDGWVWCVVFSPDGRHILSGNQDHTLQLHDAVGQQLRTFRGHKDQVHSVAFSPDGKRAVSGSFDETIRLWDVETGQQILQFENPQAWNINWVLCVAYSPDGKRVASAHVDGAVRLWDPATGKEITRLAGHSGKVNSIAFSPDGRYLLSGGHDRTIRLWDAAAGKELQVWGGHQDEVTCVAFSPDGRQVLSASKDRTIRLFRLETPPTGRPPSPRFGAADRGGRLPLRALLEGHSLSVWTAAFSPDGKTVATVAGIWADDPGEVKLWDAATGRPLSSVDEARGVRCVAFSRDGRALATGSYDGTVKLHDLTRPARDLPIQAHEGLGVNSVAFSPDGRLLATGGLDNKIKLWDLATRQPVGEFPELSDWVLSVAFSPDGQTLATALHDGGEVKLWDVATRKLKAVLHAHTGTVEFVTFSPDGRLIASAGWDGMVKLSDAATGKEVAALHVDRGSVWQVAFSPDGRLLATAAGPPKPTKEDALQPGEAKLWYVPTGQELLTLHGHTGQVTGVAFSPDGKTLATASWDKTVRLWDLCHLDLSKMDQGKAAPGGVRQLAPQRQRPAPGQLQKQEPLPPGAGSPPEQGRGQNKLLRWQLTFNTENGPEYVKQLQALGATLYFQVLGQWYLVHDLSERPAKPRAGAPPASQELLYWIDSSPASVERLSKALGLEVTPQAIVVIFPARLERQLAELERKAFPGREDPNASTRFRVMPKDGTYEVVVAPAPTQASTPKRLSIGIDLAEGKAFVRVAGEQVAPADLAEVLKRCLADAARTEAVIEAAGDVPYATVQAVLDALRQAGVQKVNVKGQEKSP